MCEDCELTFESHNPKRRGSGGIITCGCAGCQSRIQELQTAEAKHYRETAFQNRGVNMASINICERKGCSSFIKGTALGALTLVFNPTGQPNSAKRMELCPGCIEDVYGVISVPPITSRERAYEEAFDPERSDTADAIDGVTDEQLAAELFQRMMRNARTQIEGRSTKVDSE